jgi:hypothetical protein
MEDQDSADRATRRSLRRRHPDGTQHRWAEATGCSVAWVKKWAKRLRAAPPEE